MAEKRQKTAALDIGGVCINIFIQQQMQKMGINPEQFAYQGSNKIVRDWECGLIEPEEMYEFVLKISSRKDLTRTEVLNIWDGILGESVTGMADAVRTAISRGWRFIYFSNIDKIHVQQFLSKNDFCHLISGHIFSCDIGHMKPEAEMYAKFEEEYGKPDAYFDDLQKNIDAGLQRGWNSILFTGAQVVLDNCK